MNTARSEGVPPSNQVARIPIEGKMPSLRDHAWSEGAPPSNLWMGRSET